MRVTLATIGAVPILAAAAWGFWPRASAPDAAPAPAGAHQHGAPSTSSTAPYAPLPAEGSAPVPPGAADTTPVGSRPQTSLLAAASRNTGSRRDDSKREPRADVRPDSVVKPSVALGGCLKQYGTTGQCLAVYPPSAAAAAKAMGMDPSTMPHAWTCAEVRTYFPKGIAVREPGHDPQHLDTDADGVACGSDD